MDIAQGVAPAAFEAPVGLQAAVHARRPAVRVGVARGMLVGMPHHHAEATPADGYFPVVQ